MNKHQTVECCSQCGTKSSLTSPIIKSLCLPCRSKEWELKYKHECEEKNLKHRLTYLKQKKSKLLEQEDKRLKDLKYLKKNKEKKLNTKTCKILKEHVKEMKNDPEHLTTKFMQKLIGIKCKPKKINVTHDNS